MDVSYFGFEWVINFVLTCHLEHNLRGVRYTDDHYDAVLGMKNRFYGFVIGRQAV